MISSLAGGFWIQYGANPSPAPIVDFPGLPGLAALPLFFLKQLFEVLIQHRTSTDGNLDGFAPTPPGAGDKVEFARKRSRSADRVD